MQGGDLHSDEGEMKASPSKGMANGGCNGRSNGHITANAGYASATPRPHAPCRCCREPAPHCIRPAPFAPTLWGGGRGGECRPSTPAGWPAVDGTPMAHAPYMSTLQAKATVAALMKKRMRTVAEEVELQDGLDHIKVTAV